MGLPDEVVVASRPRSGVGARRRRPARGRRGRSRPVPGPIRRSVCSSRAQPVPASIATGPTGPAVEGGVRVRCYTPAHSSLFPRRQVVGGDFDPGARGRHRSLGEPGPPRSAGCESRPHHPAARGSRTATNYRIRPVPGLRLRDRPRLLRLLGADARRARPRRLLRQRRVLRLPAGLPLPALADRRARPAQRRPGRGRDRAAQAAADPHRRRRRLRPLPARARAGRGPDGRPSASRSSRPRSTCSTRPFYDSALWGQTRRRRSARAAARRRGAHPRQQRGRDRHGARWRRSSSRSSGSSSSRSSPSCC